MRILVSTLRIIDPGNFRLVILQGFVILAHCQNGLLSN